MATAVVEIEGPLSPPSCCTSINSKAASASTSKSTEDLAAMRHLRSVIESITSNENMSLAERKTKLANLEHLFLTAERQLLSHDGVAEPLIAEEKTTKKIKKVGWLKSVLRVKQDGHSRKNNNFVATEPNAPANSKQSGGVLEALDEKEVVTQEARDDVENKVVANTATTCSRDGAPPPPTSPGGGGGGDNETDSIMELRMQNSEAFLASVCSLRSLGTFERDFINNIIAEQADANNDNNNNNNDEKSTTTFEKDFLARMKSKCVVPPHPTQVFVNSNGNNPDDDHDDDLTLDTQLSETTFENDARCAMKNGGDGMILPPTQVITPTKQQNFVDSDELSIATFLSETTFERDQRKRKEASAHDGKLQAVVKRSAPTALALHIENTLSIDDSQISVSTYEKDVAALNALAEKIGRKPSTQSKVVMEGIMSTASDRSCSTFEQDYGYVSTTQRDIRIPASPPQLRSQQFHAEARVAVTMPPKYQYPNDTRSLVGAKVSFIGTPLSTTAFENDMINDGPQANKNYNPEWFQGMENRKKGPERKNVGSAKKKNVVSPPSSLDNRSRTPDLSDAMRAANAKLDAMAAAKRQQSKISPLDVQLSQYRVSTVGGGGSKSRKEEGESTFLGKFLSQAEQFIFKY